MIKEKRIIVEFFLALGHTPIASILALSTCHAEPQRSIDQNDNNVSCQIFCLHLPDSYWPRISPLPLRDSNQQNNGVLATFVSIFPALPVNFSAMRWSGLVDAGILSKAFTFPAAQSAILGFGQFLRALPRFSNR
jgi:hypothetical protein